ncbi:hypothetical protein E4S40_00855 [Algoriphagus kandeliae]|uniref:Glycosyltransferase family 1 protein n=1 Tax=Algoriphagus kandeliae TaxID=2562278 RepID=A0A4Y9QZR2_9BACT|nr:hypothetical protein [Algoriphagus kandeliae]TFV97238.1 hypothetical protein E4S40_00855 [Algoriphagus kandeliae]
MNSNNIDVLNIPSYYSTFYLKVLFTLGRPIYKPEPQFFKYDFSPILIFKWDGKLIVIDNNDPVGIIDELYKSSNFYFVTNKLKENPDYQKDRIFSLFPHYPINLSLPYFYLFFKNLRIKSFYRFLREILRISKRPNYFEYRFKFPDQAFVFFSGSIWEKEKEANLMRAEYIRFCIENENIKFEGGLNPRRDGENQGYGDILNKKNYSPREFNKLSRKSIVGFNNPAVLGALSWRFAEYLNSGVAIISLPFKIDLPIFPEDGKELFLISPEKDLKPQLELIINDQEKLKLIAEGGKNYFQTYCTIQEQSKYLKGIIENYIDK